MVKSDICRTAGMGSNGNKGRGRYNMLRVSKPKLKPSLDNTIVVVSDEAKKRGSLR